MSATISATDTINAARSAIANDVANVATAIDSAVTDMDAQLVSLHERREELEKALVAINEQVERTDEQRSGLVAARGQLAGGGDLPVHVEAPSAPVEEAIGGGEKNEAPAPAAAADSDNDEEWEYVEVDEAKLSADVPRTERLVTILESTQQEMSAAELTEVLNSYGDDTTVKVVSGTLSNLARRGAVNKTEPGVYAPAKG